VVIVESEKRLGGGLKRRDERVRWGSGGHWVNVHGMAVIEVGVNRIDQ